MKNLILTIIVFSVLLIVGCQENSITDPVSTETINKEQISDISHYGFISLEGMLNDPYPVWNSHYIVSGQVEFENIMRSNNFVTLTLTTKAELSSLCTACSTSPKEELVGTISSVSEENLLLNEDIIVLEKSFTIRGRDDMILMCRFLVSSDSVSLSGMWLEIVGVNYSQIELTD